jgi:iron complex outermembrane receptor protein
MKLKLIFTLTILLSVSGLLFSQNQKDTIKTQNLGEVIISAGRLPMPLKMNPAATSLVGQNVLSVMPRAIAADEALRLVPGVRIDNQANGSRLHMSIRGQGILSEHGLRGIKVLIDGIPVNDPTGFAADLYDIDWASVKNIEVLRGSAASLYGGSSNAGVISVATQDGGDKPIGGNISTSVGSNGFYKLRGQVDGTSNNLNYRVSYSRLAGDGYRDHTAFWGNNLNEKVTFSPSKRVKLTQILNVTDYFNQNAEGLSLDQLAENPKQANPDAVPFNEYMKTSRTTNGLLGQVEINKNQNIQFNGFLRSTNYLEATNSGVLRRNIKADGGSLQYNLTFGSDVIKNHVSIGSDFQYQNIYETKHTNLKDTLRRDGNGIPSETLHEGGDTLLANQIYEQQGLGLFLLDRLELGKKWSATFSLRYDNTQNKLKDRIVSGNNHSGDKDFDRTTARVGLSYSICEMANVYADWSQGFLPPATEELASNPLSFGGFNTDLKPATSNSEEIGIRGTFRNYVFYDVTGFIMNTDNDFYRYRIAAPRDQETFYGNVGSSNRYGIETFVSVTPIDPLSIQLAYTYSNFKYSSPDSIKDNWLPNSPEHQLNADVSYKLTKNLTIGVSTEYQSKWYIYTNKIRKDVSQDGFNLYHARLAYTWNIAGLKGEISVYAKNFTDQKYVAFTEPDDGGNSYQPGSRREFFGSLKFNF